MFLPDAYPFFSSSDPEYKKFLESYSADDEKLTSTPETLLEEIEARNKELIGTKIFYHCESKHASLIIFGMFLYIFKTTIYCYRCCFYKDDISEPPLKEVSKTCRRKFESNGPFS